MPGWLFIPHLSSVPTGLIPQQEALALSCGALSLSGPPNRTRLPKADCAGLWEWGRGEVANEGRRWLGLFCFFEDSCYVVQAGLELVNPPSSVSPILRSSVCTRRSLKLKPW